MSKEKAIFFEKQANKNMDKHYQIDTDLKWKKVKELIEQILKYCDQCYNPNWQPKSFEEFVKLGNICREAIKELSKSDWISVEDEPAPRLEWDGSWNDIVVCYKDKWVLPLSYVVRNDIEFTHWRRIEKLEE